MAKRKKKRRIPPPVLMLICLLLMFVLCRIWPVKIILTYPLNLVGFVSVAAGFFIGTSGVLKFRKVKTNIHPFRTADKLVTDGVYQYSRNPMYLGLTLLLVGAWLLLGALSPIIGVLVFIVVSSFWYILGEERMLNGKFGDAYKAYCARVRRWM